MIQRHEARRLHFDFRLEHDGVLASWALPKGVPEDPAANHLAVRTEDHPLDYGRFEGEIPAGAYGAGRVAIWDEGEIELEKWRDDEVIAVLHGRRGTHRYALIRTRGDDWLIHLMEADGHGTRRRAAPTRTAPAAGSTSIRPMLASSGTPESIDDDGSWVLEMKWDGYRAIATVRDGELSLRSRNGLELLPRFPELAVLADRVDGDVVLDGEIVAPDARGRPDFARLQERAGLTRPREVERARRRIPVQLLLFDALELDGESIAALPYHERRARLEAAVRSEAPVLVPPDAGEDLDAALALSRELGLEGVMAKRADSPYRAGRRSRDWLKLPHRLAQEVVVIGWRPARGARDGGIGSLLLATPRGGQLRYAGRVGTGFRDRDLAEASRRLARIARKTPPVDDVPDADARDANWVSARLVAEVELHGLTREGRVRQASWRGWRDDKSPEEVRPARTARPGQ